MTDIIRLLPDSIANQIAAGEVVQRPASVVKELLENAIDAGATHIQLVVKEAGKLLVLVIDNGVGMSETDARMSFERHATSKIRKAEDLFSITTMGFRGEALASIAAVAQVEMRTRRAADELGTLIRIEGSEVKTQEPFSGTVGTSIAVRNLFFNVPARRNFLKSNAVEMRHILDEFQRIALAQTDIAFSLYQNDLEVYNLPESKLSMRIVNLFGKNYREQLAACQEETPFVSISGYIGKPEFSKKTRGEQFFYVNRRFVRNSYLHHAVVSAYEGLLPEDSHPFYVLFIDIDPSHIDINVHPTKTEIKFDDERVVYTVVRSAVKKALGLCNISPSLDFETDVNFISPFTGGGSSRQSDSFSGFGGGEKPAKSNPVQWNKLYEDFQEAFIREKGIDGIKADTPTESVPSIGGRRKKASFTTLWHEFETQAALDKERREEVAAANSAVTFGSKVNDLTGSPVPRAFLEEERITFQLHQQYIVTQVKSGVLIIDQQFAHERILYEKYLSSLEKRNAASQQFLFPQSITLNPADFQLVMELEEEIRNLGFVFTVMGNNTLVVNGIPADVPEESEKDLFEGLIEQYKHQQSELKLGKRDLMARSLARRSALKPGVRLSVTEMNTLIDQLFASSNPNYAPGGNPTFVVMNLDRIAGLFLKK